MQNWNKDSVYSSIGFHTIIEGKSNGNAAFFSLIHEHSNYIDLEKCLACLMIDNYYINCAG